MNRSAGMQHAEGLSVALSDAVSENERLHAENCRVTAEFDSMQLALHHAVRVCETDELTQLSTRAVLWSRLGHDIATSARRGARLAIFFMDLDGFKGINDRLGHAVGDQMLQHVAKRLRATVRAGDTVCRLGGDEFVMVFCDITPEDVQALADKIRDALTDPCMVDGISLEVRASIGSSVYPDDGEDPGVLLRKADAAMYEAKGSRRAARKG